MADIQDGLKCYSPKTATITWSVLKNALEAARDENLIRTNPAKMVRPVSGRRRPMKVLSPAQAAKLIRNEPDPMWRLNWLLAFATGLRQGERLGLTMDELTTLNGRRALVIDHQLQRIPDSRKADWPLGEDVTDLGNGFWLCPPKTDSGERIVVLDDVMCGALDEWLAIRKQKGVDLPRAVRHLVMQPLPLHVDLEQVAFLGEPKVREHQPVRQTPVGRDDRVRGFVSHRQRRPVEVPC